MKKTSSFIAIITVVFLAVTTLAQNLTVRDIMAEPSIAGQRVEGEKLSPDGSKVVYLWNAEGKMPRDLYLVSTGGGTPQIILRQSDLAKPSATPQPENKLDYGVEVRDEFVKVRENALGGFEWSSDSRKLVFTYGGDIYVMNAETPSSPTRYLENLQDAAIRMSNVVAEIFTRVGTIPSDYRERFDRLREENSVLRSKASGSNADDIVNSARSLGETIEQIFPLKVPSRGFLSTKQVIEKFEEFLGTQNRLNVARMDHNDWLQRSKPKRFTRTQSPESGARFLDNDRILFSQSGHWFVLNTVDATLTQLTREANPQGFVSVGGVVPNKQGSMIAYVVSDSSKQRQLVVPNFVPEYVTSGGPRRGWSEQKVFVTSADGIRDTPFEIKLPKPEGVSNFRRMVWTADGQSLIVDRVDKDTKRRQLFYVHNVGSKAEQIILVTEETDDKWQAPLSAIFEPNPKDASQLFFCSERDGYNHLYLAKIEAETRPLGSVSDSTARVQEGGKTLKKDVKIIQLTKGSWQVEWAKYYGPTSTIVYLSSEKGTAERTFSAIDSEIVKEVSPFGGATVVKTNGMVESPQMATDLASTRMIVYGLSKWNQPTELFARRACPNCLDVNTLIDEKKLTNTLPEAFAKRAWTIPKFIDIPSRDGKKVRAKIYLPNTYEKIKAIQSLGDSGWLNYLKTLKETGKSGTKKREADKGFPMVVFVHGAGYLQNVINGWNNYFREFMFNDLLAKKGYVVLDIDYRGSAGYGRDWRTDVYDFLGGKDFDDHIDAIDFMVKNYGVDQKRIGVYGGSYGGFMAGMLAMCAPERIAAAAALRPVFDWKNYYAANPQYTAQRLGFPDKNPEAYKRSSPISYADKLERPLLILHGMSDDNVHVQDSVQMMEKLIRLGKTKYFEAMLYPSENHGFVRPESWTDEYERIFAFFEKHLK